MKNTDHSSNVPVRNAGRKSCLTGDPGAPFAAVSWSTKRVSGVTCIGAIRLSSRPTAALCPPLATR